MKKGESVTLKQTRGLGTDVAIVGSMIFVAQIIVSMTIGTFIQWLGTPLFFTGPVSWDCYHQSQLILFFTFKSLLYYLFIFIRFMDFN